MPGAVAGTWTFAYDAILSSLDQLKNGESGTDFLTSAIQVIESDEEWRNIQVGVGSIPNSDGDLELDAAIMDGATLNCGAIAALKGTRKELAVQEDFQTLAMIGEKKLDLDRTIFCICGYLEKYYRYSSAIGVARKVLDDSPHCLIVGTGARRFADGYSDSGQHVNEQPVRAEANTDVQQSHDTLSIIALDLHGNISVGVASAGQPRKHPGRVGDSPVIGSGLYADNRAGAACCTGDGDSIMKFCPSFHCVQLMKQGQTPQDAVATVQAEITDFYIAKGICPFEIGIIAMDMQGHVAAGGTVKHWTCPRTKTVYTGMPFAVSQNINTTDVYIDVTK